MDTDGQQNKDEEGGGSGYTNEHFSAFICIAVLQSRWALVRS